MVGPRLGVPRGWGLRGRLVFLVFLGLVPAFAVLVRGALLQRDATIEAGRQQALRLASAFAGSQQRVLEDTALVLDVLARAPAIRTGTAAEAAALLADVQESHPRIANLGIVREDGSVRATVLPAAPGLNLGDRTWFRGALERDAFTVGAFQVGRITGIPSVNCALPIVNGSGGREVLFAALDLARLHDDMAGTVLPEGANLRILDTGGRVLIRLPDRGKESREALPSHSVLRAALSGASGVVEGVDADEERRLFGHAPLHAPGGGAAAYLLVGLAEGDLLRAADRAVLEGLGWMAAIALLGLGAAFLFGDYLVVREVTRLEAAAERLRAGDLSVRVGPDYGPGRLGTLGRAFDGMAESLEGDRRTLEESREALRKSEELFRHMAETIDGAFWVSEPGERPIKYVSPGFERIWGISAAALHADHRLWEAAIHPEDRARVREAIARNEEAGTYDETYRVVRPDGTVRWVRDRAFPVRDDGGRILRIYGLAEDVSRDKELEHQFLQSQKMEAVGRLAAGVAHDFNNLLTVIGGYSQLVAQQVEGGLREYVEEVRRASDQAAALTAQLLSFSRRQVLAPAILDLGHVVAGMEGMLRRLVGPRIEIVRVPPRNAGGAFADPHQVQQVVMNLVVNARDAMPGGGRITIETYGVRVDSDYSEVHLQSKPGHYVVISVTDTGTGMTDEVRARIFEPFFTTKEEGRGTGLGLSTVQGIVKQAGGDIFVYSEVGVGTTFKVYFPRRARGAREAVAASAPSRQGSAGPSTVLLVEDDPSIRNLVLGFLGDRGHRVLPAGSGTEALRVLANHPGPVDALVTDVALPGMDGFEVAERVRAARPGMPVLFVSGYSESARDHPLPRGSIFLQKPFNLSDLADRLEAQILAGR